MEPDDLLLVLAGLLVGALGISGLRSLRASVSPTGYWPLGWAALTTAGVFSLLRDPLPGVAPAAPALVALFAPLMAAGALQHVGRPVPRWLLPAAAVLSVAGLLSHLAGNELIQDATALAIQPALLVFAVWVLRASPPHWSTLPLQCGLLGIAAVSVSSGLGDITSLTRDNRLLAWILIAVPTGALQTIAGFDRVRKSAEHTEQARQRASERFQALVTSLDQTPVLLFNTDGRLTEVLNAPNKKLQAYGVTAAETTTADALRMVSAEGVKRFLSVIREVITTENSQAISLETTFPAGIFCVEVALSPVRGTDGAVESVIGVVHDVTQHVHDVRALRESEQNLHGLLAALAANRVVVIDADGIIQYVVAAVDHGTTPYGIERQQIEGIQVADLLPGPAGKRVLAMLRRVYEGGKNLEFEECVQLPGGEFHFAISLRPLLDEHGSVENVLAVCTDISERMREKQEHDAFEAQVQQAQKLESIGVLAGGIAHDFNNLLTGILGNVELALEDVPPDGRMHHLLRDIEDASLQAADLTAQILAYAGKKAIAPSVIEIGEMIQDMAPLLRTGIVGGAELRIRHVGEPGWIQADATQIRQVVMNLVTNALESLGEAGGKVEIETRVADASQGRRVCVEVRDNGCGMDAATQQRIYEPFYSTKFDGRGLGLAGALGIARSHGGEMQVESEPGTGSVFRILLPRVDAPAVKQAGETPGPDPASTERGTVLVVDDEPPVRKVAMRMLHAMGYRAVCAASGREALALLAGAPGDFAAMLLDLTMPDWPGERAAASLRNVRQDLPIVFMTGHSEREALERTRGIDRTHFLAKPFRREQLATALAKLIKSD